MKKTWIIRALLLIAYCVPFAFLSVMVMQLLEQCCFMG